MTTCVFFFQMAESSDLVLVTGASGYIATHVVKLLQEQGYMVRATVRSLKNEAKVKPLRELCPTAIHPIELVEADLTNEESWIPAVKDCKYVLHIASPFPFGSPANEDEIIKPAVNGTLAVLKACGESVKRVVLTSSVAAVNNGYDAREKLWTEEDWTDPEKATAGAYVKSKGLAEKAAWDYVKGLPEEKKFELAVVNPGYVVGPLLCGAFTTSMEIPRRILQREMPALPKFGMGMVDVRDVALAHVNAMTVPDAAGHRHILVTEAHTMKEIAVILDAEFRPQGYNPPTAELPNFLVKMASWFDKNLRFITPALGKCAQFDNTRMKSVLDITPREMKNTICDMAYSMIEAGHIIKTQKYTGPNYSE